MSYQEKRTIASLVSGVPVLVAYCIHAFLKWQAGGEAIAHDLASWAITMLIFIGIGIVVAIITQIVFHIVFAAGGEIKKQVKAEIRKEMGKHAPDMSVSRDAGDDECAEIEKEDEMDKLINLKSMRIGYIAVGAGFMVSLVTLALKLPPAVMLNTAFLSFGLGSLLEAIAQLHYYRRGV